MYRNIERTWNRKTIFTVANTYVDIKKKFLHKYKNS